MSKLSWPASRATLCKLEARFNTLVIHDGAEQTLGSRNVNHGCRERCHAQPALVGGGQDFKIPFQRRARRAHRPSEHHPSRMRCATVCSREPGFARSATGTSDRPVQHRSMHPCRRASQNARLVRVSSVPFRRSSPDRSAARARSDRAPRRSSAARRGRAAATGVPRTPYRGRVPGRRQPPAPCARVAVMSGDIAPASRSIAPCARDLDRARP